APEAFGFTFPACPDRHIAAADMLSQAASPAGHPDRLPAVLTDLMRDIGIPNGISAVGYNESDIDMLVVGTMRQQRLLATAPRPPAEEDIAAILRRSLVLW